VAELGAGELCRVTVVGHGRRLDVALPAEVALAELVPTLLRTLVNHEPPTGDRRAAIAPGDTSGWVLQRLDGTPLDLSANVASAGVRQGDLLQLRRREWAAVPPVVDDLVEAIGTAVRGLPGRWSGPAARAWTVASAVVLLIGAAAIAAGSGPPWPPVFAVCAVLAGVLITAAGVVSRAAGRAEAALVFALASTVYAFVAGLALFHPAPGATGIGAVQVLVGAAAVLPVLAVGALLVPTEAAAFIGVGVAAGCAAAGALTRLLVPGHPDGAAVSVCLGVLLAPWLPAAALRLSGLPMPALPTSRPELSGVGTPVLMSEVERGTRLADRTMTAMLAALCTVSALGGLLLVGSPGIGARVLLGSAAVALTLRARHFPGLAQRQWAYGCGLVLVLEFAASVIVHSGQFGRVVTATVMVLSAAAVALAGPWRPERRLSPALGRAADLVEVLAVLLTVPATAVALGVFDAALALGG
jgi:type VII secretion integral membrane protein EccD